MTARGPGSRSKPAIELGSPPVPSDKPEQLRGPGPGGVGRCEHTAEPLGVDLSKTPSTLRRAPRRGARRRRARSLRRLARRPRARRLDRLRGPSARSPAPRRARAQPASPAAAQPAHAWHFARSLNLLLTGRFDAALLDRLVAERQPAPDAPLDPAGAGCARTSSAATARAHETRSKTASPPARFPSSPGKSAPSSPPSPAASRGSRRRSPTTSPAIRRSRPPSACSARSPASSRSPP